MRGSKERATVKGRTPALCRCFRDFATVTLNPNEQLLGEEERMRKFVDFKEGEYVFRVHGGPSEQRIQRWL